MRGEEDERVIDYLHVQVAIVQPTWTVEEAVSTALPISSITVASAPCLFV